MKALPLFLPPSSPLSFPLFILQSLSARVNPFPSLLPFGCFLLSCFTFLSLTPKFRLYRSPQFAYFKDFHREGIHLE